MAHAIARLLALAALAALAAAQIKSEPPRVFLDQLKLPPGFRLELYYPGFTLDGLRDVVPSGASQQGGPIIVRRLAAAIKLAERPAAAHHPAASPAGLRLCYPQEVAIWTWAGEPAATAHFLQPSAASQPCSICTAGTGAR